MVNFAVSWRLRLFDLEVDLEGAHGKVGMAWILSTDRFDAGKRDPFGMIQLPAIFLRRADIARDELVDSGVKGDAALAGIGIGMERVISLIG